MYLDEWQELVLRSAMGERVDGTWAAKRVGLSVPRQNGKSQLMVARILAGVLLLDERKIVVSAHQQDTARESFNKMMEIIEDDANESLRSRIRPNGIMTAINREAIKFKNGATVQFKARSGAGGRGFSSDCLMLDEAQILSQRAWVSINSTMSAMPNPQVWLMGTPPTPEDDGLVFGSVRDAAINGKSDSSAWVEWSALPDDDPASDLTRWKANPAWNTRINHEIVDGEFETYPPERFALDRLGIWASENGARRAISAKLWEDTAVDGKPDGAPSYAVAFSADSIRVSLAGGVAHDDGVHVELLDRTDDGLRGLGPLADWLTEKNSAGVARWRASSGIVLSGQSGAHVLKQLLLEKRVPARRIQLVNTTQYLQACGMLDDSLKAGTVTHLRTGQGALDDSVAIVDRDKRGGWTPTTTDGDETPVEAISLALYGARTGRAPRTTEQGGVMIL